MFDKDVFRDKIQVIMNSVLAQNLITKFFFVIDRGFYLWMKRGRILRKR